MLSPHASWVGAVGPLGCDGVVVSPVSCQGLCFVPVLLGQRNEEADIGARGEKVSAEAPALWGTHCGSPLPRAECVSGAVVQGGSALSRFL